MAEKEFFGHIIDNEEVESLDGRRFDIHNPWTQQVWAEASEASAEDAERAVRSARRAFDEGPWPRMGRAERAGWLHKLADAMEERVDEFARLHNVSETTVRECLAGVSKNYPPLRGKRTKPGRGGTVYITAEQAAEWRAALKDA